MIKDPFYLYNIVKANAEITAAMEHLDIDDPQQAAKHSRLVMISKQIASLIIFEVV